MARQSGFGQAFGALAYRDYRSFAVSLLLTSVGAQLLQIAILWQVYEITGSALLLGLTGLARALPHIIFSMAGGVIADRVNRVRLIQAGQVLNAALVLALAALTLTGAIELWHLYAITLLNGAFTAATQPARTALIPSLIKEGSLVNAVALNATIGQTSQIAGPALAGLAIAAIGLGATYVFTGALYLLAVVAIAWVSVNAKPEATGESPWRSFLDGLVFVRQRPVIISLLMLDVGQTLFGGYRALLPILADNLGVGVFGYGILSAAPGVGSLLGAGFILSLGDMRYKGLYTVFGVLSYCGVLVVLAISPWFPLTLVAAALLGTTNSIQMIPRNSAILAISPDAMRGRVEAFRSMLAGGAPPLGYTLNGGLASALGPEMALVVGAILCSMLVGTIGLSRHELRDPDLGTEQRPAITVEPEAGVRS